MVVIDVEASGLADQSYPIEIAWQDSEKRGEFDSFLIKPFDDWTYWDDHAEQAIHHISRAELFLKGISPEEACNRLNQRLKGQTVYSDAIRFDQGWIMKMFESAGMEISFGFESIFSQLPKGNLENYNILVEKETVKHRALNDARQIIQWVRHLS